LPIAATTSGPVTSDADGTGTPRLPTPWLVALHLAPGIVFTLFFFVLSGVFTRNGLTAYLAELIAIPSCLVPTLLGIVFLWSRRSGDTRSLVSAISYRERGTLGDYVVLPVLLYLCWALCSLLVVPSSEVLEARLFGWFPASLTTHSLMRGISSTSPGQRHVTFVLAILLSGILAPLAEETYFRGFLLPRMRHLGWRAPLVNTFLFGLYHFFSPWNLPVIFAAFLPVVFVVQARRNFRIGLVLHAMFNLTGVFNLFVRMT
jgi:hypothetical protein